MASKEEHDLDELFSELATIEAAPRDEAAERARRLRIGRAIEKRARAEVQVWGTPRKARVSQVVWALGSAAAALVLVFSIASVFRKSEMATVEPERIAFAERSGAPAPPSGAAATSTALTASPLRPPLKEVRPSRILPPSNSQRAPSAAPPESSQPPSDTAPDAEMSGASLAAQNELFQSAVRAARRGDDEGALHEFDLLLERFPTSPLAADALVRKFRTLARLGRSAESAAVASEYLARYPQGFAAAEAQKLLSGAMPDAGAQ